MDNTFAQDVLKGLTSNSKYLSSKYFYDDIGSRIFQEIMEMPEYYLTNAEFEILSLQSKQIVEALQFSTPFNIVELGAGDGFKTFKLLEYLVNQKIEFNYIPIDISQEAIDVLSDRLTKRLPGIVVKPKVGDYFEILKQNRQSDYPSLLLFLGGNIGNYNTEKAIELLELFHSNMKLGDKLLIGFDIKKNPVIIHNAYYDPHGITKRFNLNLLLRINRELGADFKIDDFDFYCHYNPLNGEVRSYLVSLRIQTVHIKSLDKHIHFDQNEIIWTELSKKYGLDEIVSLSKRTNFTFINHFLDCKHYFTDTLWEKSQNNK
ncbi:L-histidine N(alpha)-methyltransferase [Psychroserpens sp.]|uniref:L-histidine N(alpha)-methyltransferase n=1 Tax=Psychroserpens sp. TaxID=2020870 RepID=UPI001B022D57|nr:L-histidine N(alpha)-methyltransferase [Psychroserpens sp.]MBO6605752.1 L-histidine N(alpha)-methyltransferase [Psychroserpens sp.]MBO6630122.1 L-histidine N(alpha)-methyltransferase [Psychroserpens sp.]MBO6652877.1 L-histidine N(alpha)-methyltransferase [Psychroserpens sp.]MBO6681351.1 L-histidine N(alpha)-methyltransferase [Psychroserpens sp.]MBO6749126.1 L-histidine N(alpha)-methyltransferase [Psychroserpens sp.]